ncbi:MAG: zinc metalloprotease HtpX [Gammaproteobacteria bacterium]|nr:zinc metalloprotease HtpX [Gammaproteobacteria bacterium]
MSDSFKEYSQKTTDWRKSIRQNSSRTYQIIAIFIIIYVALGLLVDMFIQTSILYSHHIGYYGHANFSQMLTGPNLWQIFKALITFRVWPIATMITLAVAVISLWVTYALYDRLMLLGTEYKQLTGKKDQSLLEQQVYNVVEEMKIAAGMPYMPKVFLINADYMNAFASGYSEKSAMVAITRGLAEKLDRQELQAVMAHELSHIRHQDIKLTLTAAVLSNLVLMIIDALFYAALFSGAGRGRGRGSRNSNYLFIIIIVLRYLLPLITVLLTLYLSRTREYMADAGAVELMRDNKPLATALMKIHQDHVNNREQYRHDYRKTPHESVRRESYIFDPVQAGIESVQSVTEMFSTHPGFDKRLAALGFKRDNKTETKK